MYKGSNCDRKSQLSEILTEPLNPRDWQNSSSREKIYMLYSKIAYWCAIWNGHKTFTMCAIVYRSMRQIPNIPNIEVKKWVQTQISNPYIFVTIDYIIWSDDLAEIIVWYIWGISHRVAEIYKD